MRTNSAGSSQVQRHEPETACRSARTRPASRSAPVTTSRNGSSIESNVHVDAPFQWKALAMFPRFRRKPPAGCRRSPVPRPSVRVGTRSQKNSRCSPRKKNLSTGRKTIADVAATRRPSPTAAGRLPRRRESLRAATTARGTSTGTMRKGVYVARPTAMATPAVSSEPRSPRLSHRSSAHRTSAAIGIA